MNAVAKPFALVIGLLALAILSQDNHASLQLSVADRTGAPLPCRVHLTDPAGKPVQPPGLPFWRDHFSCDGKVTLQLPAGMYRYEIERGPEHQRAAGKVELVAGQKRELKIELARVAELAKEGWYAGDLHIHRPVEEIELLMKAEDLHIGPVITWWNQRNVWAGRERPREVLRRFDGNRFYHVMAGEDERGGGALLYFQLDEPLAFGKPGREHPSPMKFVAEARKRSPRVWIDIEKPFWWDVPVWLASGEMASIGLANNHMCRRQMYANEAWGRPRDERRLPPPLGNGQWTQEIYYHVLNSGLRIPPSAGSASGVLPNPVGYNRVYVHVDGDLTWEKWWAGLKAGRSFVTNGPLLLCTTNGQRPGHVFKSDDGKPIAVKIEASLTTLDRVPQLEVIQNGKVVQRIDAGDKLKQQLTATLNFSESGWFLIRAVTDQKDTFRFASTAPFYVEIGPTKRRIGKASVRFFQEWVDERIARLEKELPDAGERAEVLASHLRAREFWAKRLQAANVE
jgi:hypothetical protein